MNRTFSPVNFAVKKYDWKNGIRKDISERDQKGEKPNPLKMWQMNNNCPAQQMFSFLSQVSFSPQVSFTGKLSWKFLSAPMSSV